MSSQILQHCFFLAILTTMSYPAFRAPTKTKSNKDNVALIQSPAKKARPHFEALLREEQQLRDYPTQEPVQHHQPLFAAVMDKSAEEYFKTPLLKLQRQLPTT